MAHPTVKLNDDRIIIAIDFGSSYSGVSYTFNLPGKTPDVVPILNWPGMLYFPVFLLAASVCHS